MCVGDRKNTDLLDVDAFGECTADEPDGSVV